MAETRAVYVLHGDDAFLRDARRKQILDLLVGDADPQLCVTTFDGSAELADVLDELRTAPFLAPCRVVILRDADEFVSTHRQALERFLQSPPTSAALILIVSTWRSNTRLAKLLADIGEVCDCSAPDSDDLAGWAVRHAARRGKQIEPDAAELLAQWIGADLAALDAEVEKLSLYVGERAAITLDDVGALVTASAGPAAFELTNALTDGEPAAALKALDRMLRARGDEFRTLGMIAWHLRRALQAKELLTAGRPAQQALPRMPSAPRAALLALLKRRPLSAFREDFRQLIRADLAMKSGTAPPAAMRDLVVALCS
jgi:DNA polymerase-3 subunit delta